MPRARTPPVIDETHAAFMIDAVSIMACSRDADNIPSLSRAVGCRVTADRRRVTVLVAASQAGALLADVSASGAIAVVFTRPSTHQTIQLKGADAAIVAPLPGDRALMERYAEAMTVEIGRVEVGLPAAFVRAMLACAPEDVTAIAFTVAAAFIQTPGPRAGAPLAA